jgi:hypothetical protein
MPNAEYFGDAIDDALLKALGGRSTIRRPMQMTMALAFRWKMDGLGNN